MHICSRVAVYNVTKRFILTRPLAINVVVQYCWLLAVCPASCTNTSYFCGQKARTACHHTTLEQAPVAADVLNRYPVLALVASDNLQLSVSDLNTSVISLFGGSCS